MNPFSPSSYSSYSPSRHPSSRSFFAVIFGPAKSRPPLTSTPPPPPTPPPQPLPPPPPPRKSGRIDRPSTRPFRAAFPADKTTVLPPAHELLFRRRSYVTLLLSYVFLTPFRRISRLIATRFTSQSITPMGFETHTRDRIGTSLSIMAAVAGAVAAVFNFTINLSRTNHIS